MKILLTGATGYIGKRILPLLIQKGHHVVCCVRDQTRFNPPESLKDNITIVEADLLNSDSLSIIPRDIDVAYYLVHSMTSSENYRLLEKQSAVNFKENNLQSLFIINTDRKIREGIKYLEFPTQPNIKMKYKTNPKINK